VRRAVLLLLLVGLVAPASAAQACDTVQVETLDTQLPAAPVTVAPGRALLLPLRVTRAGAAASGVDVFAALGGPDFAVYKSGVTGSDGTAVLSLAVPRTARGPVALDVQAYRTLVDLPCAGIEEYDRSARPWGRAG